MDSSLGQYGLLAPLDDFNACACCNVYFNNISVNTLLFYEQSPTCQVAKWYMHLQVSRLLIYGIISTKHLLQTWKIGTCCLLMVSASGLQKEALSLQRTADWLMRTGSEPRGSCLSAFPAPGVDGPHDPSSHYCCLAVTTNVTVHRGPATRHSLC